MAVKTYNEQELELMQRLGIDIERTKNSKNTLIKVFVCSFVLPINYKLCSMLEN